MRSDFSSPFALAAHGYVESGLAVIPLHPGKKEPATLHGTKDWTDNPGQVDFWWGQGEYAGHPKSDPMRNVGIVCGQVSGGVIAIDLDVHDAEHDGTAFLRDWEVEHGRLPETWTQITGSGGRQMLYRTGRDIRNSANGELGVDVRGEGGYIVAPPSIHPNGEAYEWSVSPDDCDIADADDNVYDFIAAVQPSGSSSERKPLFSLPSEITQNRNDTLFRYASSLREKGLDDESIYVLLCSANSTRCKPPLNDYEVRKIAGSVSRYEPGNERKRDDDEGEEKAPNRSIFDRPKKPAKKIADETVSKVLGVLLSLDEVREGVKLNTFDGRLHVTERCIPDVPFDGPHVLGAGESVRLRSVLERDYGVRNKQRFEDALMALGSLDGQQYNPMDGLLESLPKVRFTSPQLVGQAMAPIEISHDGGETWESSTAVCGTLTYKYLGTEPTEYSMEVEKLMFRQLVARAKYPGCKADQMCVFVGAQGTGKSTFVSLLALDRAFMLEGFSDFNVEDLKRISGKLVVEIPELDGFNGRDKNRIKSVITQTSDNYRESYARNPVEHPRTALFFGTTNDGTFLNDNTGGRRYLLVESKRDMCAAHPGLFDGRAEADIRQAWAETIALHDSIGGEEFKKTLVLPVTAQNESLAVQEKYSEEDVFRTSTLSYLEDCLLKGVDRVNVKMVFMEGLGYSEVQFANTQKWMQRAVTSALDSATDWERVGKQRLGKFGISRTWQHVSALPDK